MKQFKNEQERDKIIERIRKILALAKGTTFEGEASTAMAMAQSYMKQYGLSLSEVELKEELEEPIHKDPINREVGNQEKWELDMCKGLAVLFDCKMILVPTKHDRGWQAAFIGFEKDTQMCKLVFQVLLVGAKSAAGKLYPGDMNGIRSFLAGLGRGILNRCWEEKEQARTDAGGVANRYALVVQSKTDKVKTWISTNLELKTAKSRSGGANINPVAYALGAHHAKKMDLLNKSKLTN